MEMRWKSLKTMRFGHEIGVLRPVLAIPEAGKTYSTGSGAANASVLQLRELQKLDRLAAPCRIRVPW